MKYVYVMKDNLDGPDPHTSDWFRSIKAAQADAQGLMDEDQYGVGAGEAPRPPIQLTWPLPTKGYGRNGKRVVHVHIIGFPSS